MNSYLTLFAFVVSVFSQHTGNVSYNTDSDGFGKCSIPANSYTRWASVGPSTFSNSAVCGQCVEITNPDNNAVTVAHVVDQCLGCGAGDLNLSVPAFSALGDLAKGRLPAQWKFVRCPDISGNMQYVWQAGSNEWWGSFQILNHAEGIQSVAVGPSPAGPFTNLERRSDNYFLIKQAGPFSIKVTSVSGKTVIDSNLRPLETGGPVASSGQF